MEKFEIFPSIILPKQGSEALQNLLCVETD